MNGRVQGASNLQPTHPARQRVGIDRSCILCNRTPTQTQEIPSIPDITSKSYTEHEYYFLVRFGIQHTPDNHLLLLASELHPPPYSRDCTSRISFRSGRQKTIQYEQHGLQYNTKTHILYPRWFNSRTVRKSQSSRRGKVSKRRLWSMGSTME